MLALMLVVGIKLVADSNRSERISPAPGDVASAQALDLSQLPPRQRADSLFNRIMREHERGAAGQASFFAPMAVQAYSSLGELDSDARYHLGLVQAVAGQVDAALAQADSLDDEVPGHLFASMLRATAARMQGDSLALHAALRRFLENYDEESASGKSEYDEHRRGIDAVLSEAQGASSGTIEPQ